MHFMSEKNQTKLEDLKAGALVQGLIPSGAVKIINIEWSGNQALNVIFEDADGSIDRRLVYRDEEHSLQIVSAGRTWSFDADGRLLRLVIEATRIKLAHHFDPFLAIHTSLVQALPHQITAVYGEMLQKQPLRFLLADDPGAGKTIMAGLLIKELMARGDMERCLVVAPGGLVEQWQDELGDKFNLEFDILSRDMIENSRSGNPFNDRNHLISRLDVLARNEELQEKLVRSEEWDLIISDEAHRMSASYFGGDVKYTKRYLLGQNLGRVCRHFLLMSATPHNGKEEDFQLFMALLDGDRFEGRFRDGVHYADTEDMMRRLTKEELLKFDGTPLFPERRAYTIKYELSDEEASLYAAVTEYVRTEMNRVQRFTDQDGRRRVNIGFALQILQRRLASSPAAIYESLKRRRERLENELAEARLIARGIKFNPSSDTEMLSDEVLRNIDEYGEEEVEEFEETISTTATSAETLEQLKIEVETLKALEQQALRVLRSGNDTKWRELNKILEDELMIDGDGVRRKLIIFTEAKDTLHYLAEKIRKRLGNPENVEVIHGGVTREERRKVISRFMQDRDMVILVANDAAGEGVNLQRGHLMVNYDLPWNPNKIEQRFGRIHRIGQTEVCHLWNLVAADTREGEVYARLLEKLETARSALKGRVYDVLGELFEDTSLKDLLWDAIQYGEREDVKAKLFEKIDGAVDYEHISELLNKRKLTNDMMPESAVEQVRLEMERAEAQRLQPHHIQSFFIEAFKHLGGRIKDREHGRFEITHVPVRIRERDRLIGKGAPVQKRFERICFDKQYINKQPVAEFICPGHPLLEAVISLTREQYGELMKLGAVMVDESDPGEDVQAIFLLEHSIVDGRKTSSGTHQIVSQRLQFASIQEEGIVLNAGIAPHLNLRASTQEEVLKLKKELTASWLAEDLESKVKQFTIIELAQSHLKEVKERRIPEVDKTEREVEARLKKEVNYWDSRAFELKEEAEAGKKTRLNWENAQRRAEDLADRLKRRMEQLTQEKSITAAAPIVRGGLIVVPQGLLNKKGGGANAPIGFAQDAASRREIEIKAMRAVMEVEQSLGNEPKDVSDKKVGYDILSFNPRKKTQRFIEVKGRIEGADTVMLTRNEIITSLNMPDEYILAIVQVNQKNIQGPHYVYGALSEYEPSFEQTAIQFKLNSLLERAETPR
jgi:superfamily II DNA or RNA helicase